MAGKFDQDTTVTVNGGTSGAAVSADWSLHQPVSGYLAAIALRAAGHADGRPISASFDFTQTPKAGAVSLATDVLSASAGRLCTSVTMRQADQLVLAATVWSAQGNSKGFDHDYAHAPSVAHAEVYPTLVELARDDGFGGLLPVFHVIEERPVDWNSPKKWRRGRPEQTAWFRYPDEKSNGDAFLEAAKSLVPLSMMPAFASMVPHPVWTAASGQSAATTRLAVNFHDADSTDWILVKGEAPWASGGLVSGSAQAWNSDGKLLASAITQFANA